MSCEGTNQVSESVQAAEVDFYCYHTERIKGVFDAHGGFDTWSSLKLLTYVNEESRTLVEFQNR